MADTLIFSCVLQVLFPSVFWGTAYVEYCCAVFFLHVFVSMSVYFLGPCSVIDLQLIDRQNQMSSDDWEASFPHHR